MAHVLIRAFDHYVACGPINTAQLEDVLAALQIGAEHFLVVTPPVAADGRTQLS
jgi:hypothetical protein